MNTKVFISAVILLSREPGRLADFYRTIFGIPLVAAQHVDSTVSPHFECELGDLHFAVHPMGDCEPTGSSQSLKFALAIDDLGAALRKLHGVGVEPLYEPVDRGFARMTAFHDPDGNLVELTQLTSSWLEYLKSRPQQERDVVLGMTRLAEG